VRASAPPPLPTQRKSRVVTPTPTPVDPRVLGLEGSWKQDAMQDADPTEIGTIPTEVGAPPIRRASERPIDADSTERIDPPRLARLGRRPRTARDFRDVREVGAPPSFDPRREIEAHAPGELHRPSEEPSYSERLAEDEAPTTLFDRRAIKGSVDFSPRPPIGVPPPGQMRASTTERAPAPVQNLGRTPQPDDDGKAKPPIIPRTPRRGP
jgi:hypothetical protein